TCPHPDVPSPDPDQKRCPADHPQFYWTPKEHYGCCGYEPAVLVPPQFQPVYVPPERPSKKRGREPEEAAAAAAMAEREEEEAERAQKKRRTEERKKTFQEEAEHILSPEE